MGLGRDLLAWHLGQSLLGCQDEAAAQEIKACPAIHGALEHLQPVAVPFHGAAPPGQGAAGFAGRISPLATFCEALKRGQ